MNAHLDTSTRALLHSLIREYDRITEATPSADGWLRTYREGQEASIRAAIALVVGAYGIHVPNSAGGVPAWLPTLRDIVGATPRHRIPGCETCEKADDHYPSHDPSPRCESGSRPHCTCDTCF